MQSVSQPVQPVTPLLRALSFHRTAEENYPGRTTCLLGSMGVAGTPLLTASETGDSHSLHLITVQPGARWMPLASSTENTVYYVVEGRPTLCLSGVSDQSDKALAAFVPKGVRFVLHNDGEASAARLLRLALPTRSQNVDAAYLVGEKADALLELTTHRSRSIVSGKNAQGVLLWMDIQADYEAFVPSHIHHREDETFYIVSGRFVIEAGDAVIEAGPGDVVFGPRHIAHSWRCVSPEGGRVQILVTPGENFETFFRTMAERGVNPDRDMADPVLAARFMALTEKHGIQMLPPQAIK